MDASVLLAQHMPYTTAFPKALGTGLLISTARPVSTGLHAKMERLIDGYEHVLSRFRADSLVTRIGNAEHGGHFDFPNWTGPLFDLYDALHDVTHGTIDPCVGEDLIRLGYDASMNFTVTQDAPKHLGALRGRSVWGHDVERHGTTLVTHDPVQLDFGACGKGYLVDLLGGLLGGLEPSCVPREPHPQHAMWKDSAHTAGATDFNRENTFPEFVIDAGGDLLVHASIPIRVALEDPDDSSRAVGVAEICDGALCASAPSRRHWEVAVDERTHLAIHHLINAVDGLPAQQMEATWITVQSTSVADYPTAVADGLATALFVADPNELSNTFAFDCATLDADRHATISAGFPGRFF
nr:FAD:protein FMN transferase [Bifidobacterium catenulatum]